jgi:serine kinase of HPr protein (carbohydrate metabolism regulator)
MTEPGGRASRHASCVALGGHGVLILGESGSGKSDLALRLIDQPGRGIGEDVLTARLVADDQVMLEVRDGRLVARPAPVLAGLLEVRGVGIVRIDHLDSVVVDLVVELMPVEKIERLPEADDCRMVVDGIGLPRVAVDPRSASAPARVRCALGALLYGRRA